METKNIAHHVGVTHLALKTSLGNAFARAGYAVTPEQWKIMKTLEESPGMTQSGVVDVLGKSQSSLSKLVGRLEAGGLVTVLRGEDDKRKVCLHLTDAGRELLPKLHEIARENLAFGLRGIDENDVKRAIALLIQLENNLKSL